MAHNLDELSISISASCKDAITSVNGLSRSLTSLAKVLGGIDTSKVDALSGSLKGVSSNLGDIAQSKDSVKVIRSLGKAFGSVATQMGSFDDVSTKINELATQTENVKEALSQTEPTKIIDASALDTAKESVKEVKQALTGLASSSSDTEKEITNGLNEALRNLGNGDNISSVSDKFNQVSGSLDETTSKVVSFKEKLVGMKVLVKTDALKKTQSEISKVQEQYNKLREQMQWKINNAQGTVDESAYQKDVEKLEALRNEYNRLMQKQEELSRSGEGYKVNYSLDGFKKSLSSVISLLGKVISGIRSFASYVGNAFKKGVSSVSKFASSLLGVSKASRSSKGGMESLNKSLQKTFKSLTRMYKMLRLMIVRKILQAIIRNAITGFNNMAQYSAKFNASVSLLWNSLKQLGNAIGAMVAPLLNAFAPAINTLIQLLIQAVNWCNQLFSALTGASTWSRAKKLTDDYGKSLKNANKQLQSFDALNNLTTQDQTKPEDMFEEVEVDDKFKKISDWLKQMVEIGDFYDLGKLLGTKFRDWLNSIPWGKIQKSAKKLGGIVATLINGFVEVEGLGESIGKTLAEALNTVFSFVNGFVHKLKWKSVGKFIANTFNGFFENIKWDLIKDTVITGFKGLADAINSFVENFHWDNISKSISKAVNTLAEGIYTFVKTVKWGEIGKNLGEQLRKTIEEIDWKEIGKTFGSIINAVIEFGKSFINEQSFESILNAFGELFDGLSEELKDVDVISSITTLFNDIVSTIHEKLNEIDAVGLASALAEKLNEMITGIDFEELGRTLGTLFQKVFDFFETLLNDEELWKNVKESMQKLLKGFFESVDKEDLADVIAGVLAVAMISAGTKQILATAMASLGTLMAKGLIAAFVAYIGFNLGKELGKLFSGENELYDEFSWTGEGGFFDTLFGDISQADTFVDKIVAIKDAVLEMKDAWESMKSEHSAIGVLSRIIDVGMRIFPVIGLINLIIDCAKTLNYWVGKVKESVQGAWNDFTKWWDEGGISKWYEEDVKPLFDKENWTFEGIKEGLADAFNGAIEAIKAIWNKFANALNEKLVIDIAPINIMGKKVFDGGSYKVFQLPTFATGGFPEDGLFMANSTEMVGQFSNGKTAVANNQQIVDGIAKGVASANSEQNSLLRQQNELLRGILEKETGISSDQLFRSVQSSANSYYQRTGRYAFT